MCCPSRRSSTTCGTTSSRATPTSSRSTSAGCATSSTGLSGGRPSRRSAGPATGWRPMAADDRPRRRLRAVGGSIRWRVTLAAVVVVGLALAAGATGMITLLHRAHEDNVRTAARLRANEIAAVIETGQTPGTLAVEDDEDVLIQVLDSSGTVVASSPNVA